MEPGKFNTIDFLVKHVSNNTYHLYVGISKCFTITKYKNRF